jgi:hypothetical protein
MEKGKEAVIMKTMKKRNSILRENDWTEGTQFTAFCGNIGRIDDVGIEQPLQFATSMCYCADCEKLEHLCEIRTHHGVEKSVCRECLKHYSLRSTKINPPKIGVFL